MIDISILNETKVKNNDILKQRKTNKQTHKKNKRQSKHSNHTGIISNYVPKA